MSFNQKPIIPTEPTQQASTAKLIIKTFGLNALERNLYRTGIEKLGPSQNDGGFKADTQKTLQLPSYPGQQVPLYRSSIGTPVFTDIEFVGGQYTINGVAYQFGSVKLETVLLTVTQQKLIVKTPIQGRNGTVKEYISDGDYQVNIRGVITSPNGIIPDTDVRFLKQMLDAPIPIAVNCRWLQNLDIDNIVIDNYIFMQTEGGMSYQGFEINAISDLPVEILLAK